MIALKALVHGCWWHHDYLRERDGEERMILRCQTCGAEHTPDLSKDKIKGAAHEQAEVLGKPISRVKRHADRTKVWRIR